MVEKTSPLIILLLHQYPSRGHKILLVLLNTEYVGISQQILSMHELTLVHVLVYYY